jgi:DNA-binding MarR family transcriptional regulator
MPGRTKDREQAGDNAVLSIPAVDFGLLEEWIGFNLRIAQAVSFQAFSRRSKDVGLRPGRFATLMLIRQNPGISQTALSRANGRDKSTLTPLIADLVRRRLIRRTQARNDRRSYGLTLTSAGEKMLAQLTECARRHEDDLDRIVGRRERAQFLATLRKIAAELG